MPFNNMQTLLNQWFCVSLPSLVLAVLKGKKKVFFSNVQRSSLWVVIDRFWSILYYFCFKHSLMVVTSQEQNHKLHVDLHCKLQSSRIIEKCRKDRKISWVQPTSLYNKTSTVKVKVQRLTCIKISQYAIDKLAQKFLHLVRWCVVFLSAKTVWFNKKLMSSQQDKSYTLFNGQFTQG